MTKGLRSKLSVMMFLEFFIWGAWLPLIFGYLPSLKFSPLEQSWILNAFALASLVGMFFSNQFADRYFAAERCLAISHLIGGLSMLGLFWAHTFWPFFILMLVHSLFYVPTISITNSIAFANLKDAQKDFGPIRLWGTIGWIAASWPFVFILADWAKIRAANTSGLVAWLGAVFGTPLTGAALQEGVRWTFVAAGVASLILAGFSLLLPHTPPKPAKAGGESFAWLEAMKLLRAPFLLVLFIVTFFDACVHQCYFIWTNDFLKSVGVPANWVMPTMSIGQVAEIGTMAMLAVCLRKLGWRNIMVLGILGHTIRFAVFSLLPIEGFAIAVIMLHGVCYAFFFATVYIFVDEFFPKDARSSAQGLFNFLILGLGPFIANFVWPYIGDAVNSAVVKYQVVAVAEGKLDVNVSGFVKYPENPTSIPVTVSTKGEEPKTQSLERKENGAVSGTITGLKPGTEYAFSFPAIRRQWIVGDRKDEITADGLKIVAPTEKEPANIKGVQHDYQVLFLFPSATALFAAVLLLLFFRPPAMNRSEGGGPVATPH